MKPLRSLFFVGLGVFFLLPSLALAHPEGASSVPSSLGLIDQAKERGEIGESEALLYKLYALHQSAKLPAEFRVEAATPVKCATPLIMEIQDGLDKMPTGMAQEAAAFLARPILDSYIDTTHFRVHYATSGGDLCYGWPDTSYRDSVMVACEKSWTYYHTTWSWPVPPSDGTAGGGSGLIDCYIDDLGTSAYGVTYTESTVPGGHPFDYTSYFVIDNDYAGFGYPTPIPPMQVTVAHEFHHVVQIGLDRQSSTSWFMENTSTYMEDEVYEDINDNYNYLSLCLGSPWNSLTTSNGGWEYGAFIWPTYLDEGLGGHGLVRDIWVMYADTTNIYTVLDNQLAAYSLNVDTAMAEWARWNMFTWLHDDGLHYVDGADYHYYCMLDKFINTYPQTGIHPTSTRMPKYLGTNYTRFNRQTGSTDNKITITYQVLNSCSYNHVISFSRKMSSGAVFEEWDVPVDATGAATFELTQWDQTEYLIMGVPMKRTCSGGIDFTFSAATTYTVDVADVTPGRFVRLDQNSPNPFHPSTAIHFALRNEGPVRIAVYDANGRQVRTLIDATLPAGENEVHWGGTDDLGRPVASGVYFYTLEADGTKLNRKMTLTR